MKTWAQPHLGTVLLAIALGAIAWDYWEQSRSIEMVPYSAFEQLLRDG